MPAVPKPFDQFPLDKLSLIFELEETEKPIRIYKILAGVFLGLGFVLAMYLSTLPDFAANRAWAFVSGVALAGIVYLWKVNPTAKIIKQMKSSLPADLRGMDVGVLAKGLTSLHSFAPQASTERSLYDTEMAELTRSLELKRSSLREQINAFIKAHPALAEFYPPVT